MHDLNNVHFIDPYQDDSIREDISYNETGSFMQDYKKVLDPVAFPSEIMLKVAL